MRWFWESVIIDVSEYTPTKKDDNKHGRYIHSDGGNIYRLYIRIFGSRHTRLFQSINMFQCEKCYEFFAMEDGTHNLIPLIVKRKNSGEQK